MPSSPLVAHGGRILWVDSNYEADIVRWRLGALTRRALGASHQQTMQPDAGEVGNAVFAPGRIIGGADIVLTIHFDPSTIPPMDTPAEPIEVHFPRRPVDPFPIIWAFQGFATKLAILGPLDAVASAELTVRLGEGELRNDSIGYTEGFEWAGPGPMAPGYTEGFEWGGPGALVPGYTEGFES